MLVMLGDGDHCDRSVVGGAGDGDLRTFLAWWWSLAPAENLPKAGDGRLHHSRDVRDAGAGAVGLHRSRHVRDAG